MSKNFQNMLNKSMNAREKLLLGGLEPASSTKKKDEEKKNSSQNKKDVDNVSRQKEVSDKASQLQRNEVDTSMSFKSQQTEKYQSYTPADSYDSIEDSIYRSKLEERPIFRPRRYKKLTLQETHVQRCYYIEKEIVDIIEEIVGGDSGGKYRFVNDALKLLIFQEYPEYAHRIRIE